MSLSEFLSAIKPKMPTPEERKQWRMELLGRWLNEIEMKRRVEACLDMLDAHEAASAQCVAQIGKSVRFCGHRGYFWADIYRIGDAVLVRANPEVIQKLLRDQRGYDDCDYHLQDMPTAGYWNDRIGVFFVPAAQLIDLKKGKIEEDADTT